MKDKERPYWFNPEWKSPSDIVARLGPNDLELEWSYRLLSAAAHGSFFGMRVYRDRADEINVNPHLPPGRTAYMVALISARLLVELTALRDQHEKIGMANYGERLRDLLKATAAFTQRSP